MYMALHIADAEAELAKPTARTGSGRSPADLDTVHEGKELASPAMAVLVWDANQ